jgi:hypothetical protein
MKKSGRKAEEKAWETKFRHSFYTNYLQDPDLHVLVFVAEDGLNDIIREALRDYMAKHKMAAADPEFQKKVFMAASMQVARGHTPVGSEVMAELGEQTIAGEAAIPARPAAVSRKVSTSRSSPPAQVIPSAAPPSRAQVQPVNPPAAPPAPAVDAVEPPAAPTKKPPVVLDFGGPDLEVGTPEIEPAKPSQRDRWLARHQ